MPRKPKITLPKYEVIRDKQEKANYWSFEENDYCSGTVDESLKTGDYTIRGMEEIFTIERKWSTGEFSGNVSESRFERELDRMDLLPHSFLVFEFTLDDILAFPSGSGIPSKKWSRLRASPGYIMKRLIEIESNHKCKVIFAGDNGEWIAKLIFKRMNELYGAQSNA